MKKKGGGGGKTLLFVQQQSQMISPRKKKKRSTPYLFLEWSLKHLNETNASAIFVSLDFL